MFGPWSHVSLLMFEIERACWSACVTLLGQRRWAEKHQAETNFCLQGQNSFRRIHKMFLINTFLYKILNLHNLLGFTRACALCHTHVIPLWEVRMQAGGDDAGGASCCVFVCARRQMESSAAPPASRHSPAAVTTLPAPHPKTPQHCPSNQSHRSSCTCTDQSKGTPGKKAVKLKHNEVTFIIQLGICQWVTKKRKT